MLHPYGRYSNAFKFAGEVDVLEALADAKRRLRIDDDRISVRGFSMGGAGCWQMAVHYPDLFFAANPGAGFSETPEFLKFFGTRRRFQLNDLFAEQISKLHLIGDDQVILLLLLLLSDPVMTSEVVAEMSHL